LGTLSKRIIIINFPDTGSTDAIARHVSIAQIRCRLSVSAQPHTDNVT